MAPSVTLQPLVHRRAGSDEGRGGASSELALLEALTHEVRTPLATIRTLIRSLLRRQDLTELVRQRLQQIDGECSEQIDRFGLIFHAAELQRQPAAPKPQDLARTDLAQLLQQLEPLWRHQLKRRGLELALEIGADLSPVLSDPSRLETMLGGLMDRYSRRLTAGSTLVISLEPAGSRLRLRLGALADGVDWRGLFGTSILCGIGFTMSIFIAELAFKTAPGAAPETAARAAELLNESKGGILLGSLVSAVAGVAALWFVLPRSDQHTAHTPLE
jgi:hypothetical protein